MVVNHFLIPADACCFNPGAWIASADATTVIAISNEIGSDLGRFQDALWILAAYHLGLGPAQPLVCP